MNRHDLLIEELLLRWDKYFERLLSILEKRKNAEHGSSPANPATRRVKQTEYITERIINMSEIEGLIRSAYYNAESLLEEMKKTSPSTVRVEGLAEQIHADLLKAKDFEFCVERRKAMIHD